MAAQTMALLLPMVKRLFALLHFLLNLPTRTVGLRLLPPTTNDTGTILFLTLNRPPRLLVRLWNVTSIRLSLLAAAGTLSFRQLSYPPPTQGTLLTVRTVLPFVLSRLTYGNEQTRLLGVAYTAWHLGHPLKIVRRPGTHPLTRPLSGTTTFRPVQ